jgi:hypothetical protein
MPGDQRLIPERNKAMRLMKQLGDAVGRWSLLVMGALLFISEMAGFAIAGGGGHSRTPEIDPGAIGSAITLFVGGAMYLTSRRRAR